jgi:CO dehydrogenase/acetyl-CoA synthase beta subunit
MTNSLNFIENIRNVLGDLSKKRSDFKVYHVSSKPSRNFKDFGKIVNLDSYKEIILKEETKLELGGPNNLSLLVIEFIDSNNCIKDGVITLVGKEIKYLTKTNEDFGLLIFIQVKDRRKIENLEKTNLKFISDGIKGFMIRSIPRRFWCRINEELIKLGFSFEYFGNAIYHLYNERFPNIINSVEIIMINSDSQLLQKFIDFSHILRKSSKSHWKSKVDDWKKRVDCEYNWNCKICPYFQNCYKIRDVLKKRINLEK